jgi:D-glycerate 3-kinase
MPDSKRHLEQRLKQFLQSERLPRGYLTAVERYFRPLAAELAGRAAGRATPLVVGIQGGQGTGKSTLAKLLGVLLQGEFGLAVAELSIDDFYLTRDQRRQLGRAVHPLLATRGVPGTHDVPLALATLQRLREAAAGEVVAVPRFDKAADDRRPPQQWDAIAGPVAVIILEGWCLAVPPQAEAALAEPANALEAAEDGDGRWRAFVNGQLATAYRDWFALIDYLVVLQAPSFDCIQQWRSLQEQKLAARSDGPRIMDAAQLARFMQHYERLTRHCLAVLPALADAVFLLDRDHGVCGRQ